MKKEFDAEIKDLIKNSTIEELCKEIDGNSIKNCFGYREFSYFYKFIEDINESNDKYKLYLINQIKEITGDIEFKDVTKSIAEIYLIIHEKMYNYLSEKIIDFEELRTILTNFNFSRNIDFALSNENFNSELKKAFKYIECLRSHLKGWHPLDKNSLNEINNYIENHLILSKNLANAYMKNYSTFTKYSNEIVLLEYIDMLESKDPTKFVDLYIAHYNHRNLLTVLIDTVNFIIENKDTKAYKDAINKIILILSNRHSVTNEELINMFHKKGRQKILYFILKFMEENKKDYKYNQNTINRFKRIIVAVNV